MTVALIIVVILIYTFLVGAMTYTFGERRTARRYVAFFKGLDVNKTSVVQEVADRIARSGASTKVVPDVAGRDLGRRSDGVQLREEGTTAATGSKEGSAVGSGTPRDEGDSSSPDSDEEEVTTRRGFKRPASQRAKPRKPQKAKSPGSDPGEWKRWNA